MKTPRSITELMVSDHERIMGMFNDFKSTVKFNLETGARIFSRFESEFRKHMKVEEKLISTIFRKSAGEKENLVPIADSLKLEHETLLSNMNIIAVGLKKNEVPDSNGFYLMLRHHKNIEDRLFYPKLDDVLDEKEKNEAISIIKS
ncbi:hemerythrin domain-containing protein [Candidatus Woesearchaeota archaeon]|nr:hemerythrin domain-containing protein [Candidatus Woesearchaeota archaeon]